ncbi:VanZ family protein [Agromyces lapidis]|uniref:VanZ family protein n=1 Tax=Agromyces lapidis TaxID=279574 RepID=A0ABV5SM37_9MICO|nr:VanZ family protein [Agromyces lapidis]
MGEATPTSGAPDEPVGDEGATGSSRLRRAAAVALVLYAVALAAFLLVPGAPSTALDASLGVVREGLGWSSVPRGAIEVAANVAVFIPLGFLIAAVTGRRSIGILLPAALSLLAEAVQLMLPDRTASLRDVAANVTGAVLGALLAWAVVPHRRRPTRPPAEISPSNG